MAGALAALSNRNVECCLKLLVLCVASQLMRVYEWRSSSKRKVFHVTISKCGLTVKGFQCYLLIKMMIALYLLMCVPCIQLVISLMKVLFVCVFKFTCLYVQVLHNF